MALERLSFLCWGYWKSADMNMFGIVDGLSIFKLYPIVNKLLGFKRERQIP